MKKHQQQQYGSMARLSRTCCNIARRACRACLRTFLHGLTATFRAARSLRWIAHTAPTRAQRVAPSIAPSALAYLSRRYILLHNAWFARQRNNGDALRILQRGAPYCRAKRAGGAYLTLYARHSYARGVARSNAVLPHVCLYRAPLPTRHVCMLYI